MAPIGVERLFPLRSLISPASLPGNEFEQIGVVGFLDYGANEVLLLRGEVLHLPGGGAKEQSACFVAAFVGGLLLGPNFALQPRAYFACCGELHGGILGFESRNCQSLLY